MAWKVLALEIGVESPIDDFSFPILGLFPRLALRHEVSDEKTTVSSLVS